jgi:PAS domain S-box-containing protein
MSDCDDKLIQELAALRKRVDELERLKTEHKRADEEILERLAYGSLLSRISSMAVAAKDLRSFLNESIAVMGETVAVSRAYLFEHHHETDTMDNTHEWCAAGVVPQKESLQGLSSGIIPWWVETLKSGEYICFTNVEDIPDEGAKKRLRPQGILSILAVPLFVGGRYYGFVGFDDCLRHRAWPQEDVEILLSICRIFAVVIERKEDALRESERQFRSLIENAPDAIYVHADASFIYLNQEAARVFGAKTAGELVGSSLMERIHPDHQDMVRDRLHQLYRQRRRLALVKQTYVRLDGSSVPVEAYAVPITFGGKEAAITFARDITDRKRAEEALRETENLFRLIADNVHDTVWLMDINLRTTWISRSVEQKRGFTLEELQSLPLERHLTPESLQTALDLIGNNLTPEKLADSREDISVSVELEFYRKDGSTFWADTTVTTLRNEQGVATGFLGLSRDTTERRRVEEARRELEERLQRSEKMEALGTLAGGVAHDLNNVLGVLVGYSELLAEKLPEESPLRRYADSILQSGIRGAAIIQDLLDLARRGVAVSEVVDLNRVVFDYLRTPEFENLKYHHPQVNIRTELAEGLLNIKGSPVHLGKAIMNLASNATEAISGRGEVAIRTENRYLDHPIRGYDDMQEGDYVVLTVSDTGSGISADDRGKIFEPFYTKKVMGRSGTGLGLAVVWGTVKDHHGYIDVQTEEGKGSAFALYFPATREDPAKIEKAISSVSYMGGGESILVVDDVKEQRELAANMLGRLGYRVAAAASGEEAIAYLKSKKADLIVLDMIMDPGMDGMETYRRIIEISP